ncbi:MAG: EamA family transporter [Actinobacteria bacterium]|nr:EamA family transporter [Actinomycetota bacterium]
MRLRHAIVLAVLSLIWGASYLLIAYAVEDLPEAWVVLVRTALAAVALWVYVRLSRPSLMAQARDALRRPWTALGFGMASISAPFMLITYGERTVPTGLTAVLIASAPIFIAAMAPLLDPSESMTARQWLGLVVGLSGVGLLVGVEQLHSVGALLGAAAMIAAAASYALAGFVLKRSYPGFSPVVTSLISIAAAALIVLPAAMLQPPTHTPGLRAMGALLVLGLLGTAYAFVEYYRLIHEIGYGKASIVAYTIPPVALAYGTVFRDERIGPATIGGMALILAGVFLVARGGRRSGREAREAASASARA